MEIKLNKVFMFESQLSLASFKHCSKIKQEKVLTGVGECVTEQRFLCPKVLLVYGLMYYLLWL